MPDAAGVNRRHRHTSLMSNLHSRDFTPASLGLLGTKDPQRGERRAVRNSPDSRISAAVNWGDRANRRYPKCGKDIRWVEGRLGRHWRSLLSHGKHTRSETAEQLLKTKFGGLCQIGA